MEDSCTGKAQPVFPPESYFIIIYKRFNNNVDDKIDINGTQKYFRDLLKRKEEGSKRAAKKPKLDNISDDEADETPSDTTDALKKSLNPIALENTLEPKETVEEKTKPPAKTVGTDGIVELETVADDENSKEN